MQDGKRKTVTRQLLGACLAAFIALGTGAAQAQTAADMDARLDTLFGEHASYRGFFDKLKQAVAAGDKAAVAAMADYPFRTRLDGKAATLRDAEHFIADYDRLITPKAGMLATERAGHLHLLGRDLVRRRGQAQRSEDHGHQSLKAVSPYTGRSMSSIR